MGRKKSYDREEAAESALQVFWEKGFERTSLRDLEAATGVNRYGLYDSFKDKQGLFAECLTQYCSSAEAMIGEFAAGGFDGLLALVGRFIDVDEDEAHGRHGCLIVTSLLEQDGLTPKVREQLENYMDFLRESIRGVLDSEQRAGKLRAELDIDECLEFVQLCLVGLPTLCRTSPNSSSAQLAAKAAMNMMRSWRS